MGVDADMPALFICSGKRSWPRSVTASMLAQRASASRRHRRHRLCRTLVEDDCDDIDIDIRHIPGRFRNFDDGRLSQRLALDTASIPPSPHDARREWHKYATLAISFRRQILPSALPRQVTPTHAAPVPRRRGASSASRSSATNRHFVFIFCCRDMGIHFSLTCRHAPHVFIAFWPPSA